MLPAAGPPRLGSRIVSHFGTTMNPDDQLLANIVEHCFGSGEPSVSLLNRGAFPANWVSRYLSLLEKASHVWKERSEWPRELVTAIHFSSFYLDIRFESWQRSTGGDNQTTRKALGAIRRQSELFLLSPCMKKFGEMANQSPEPSAGDAGRSATRSTPQVGAGSGPGR